MSNIVFLYHPAPLLPGGGDHRQRLFVHYSYFDTPSNGLWMSLVWLLPVNAPSSSAPIANECPVRFSGRHGGLPLRLDASLSPLPLFSDEKRRFCAPQLCFRCISNTLQRYEKFLKLTNYKQKILKNFSSARLYCYVSSSCKNQIVKYWLQTIYVVYRHLSTAPSLAYFDYRLQITVYLWTHYPVLNLKK